MSARILALDVSLTATGVTRPDGLADTLRPPSKMMGDDRLAWWAETFHVLVADSRAQHIVIESPFNHGTHGASSLKLGEVYGVLKVELARAGTHVQTWVPPKKLKKAWTGNGNADKELMRAAAVERGLSVAGLDHNAIDALALWVCAHQGLWDE